ncbi:hypothetical protein PPTG_06286 [Phytophthora nicotianae INRA-310]|uniref:Pentacotripeptide-repeat region of PRORP domain-containing protein n=1 Tax=Phytophthora nicotianae (strain INRA-310) TaxID=761204 RepID=W2QSW3_PHYN3|nr:hypothetical protein PPTG_06286 [Phytophthora nicotianae INRA-310]ETN16056.1 hypothetical protein PPTG_06286 [Phytophthora nicotianae INRA-310]
MDLATTLKQFEEIQGSGVEHTVPLKHFARLKLFSVLRMKKEFELILTEFNSHHREKSVDSTSWMFAGALEAATILGRRQEVVKDVFQQLLGIEEEVEVSGESVYQTLLETQERGLKLSDFACRTLTGQFDVLLALANDMPRQGLKWDQSVYKIVALAHIRNGSIDKAQYDYALEMFKTLMGDGAPGAWAYVKALNAAVNVKSHSSVIEILRHMQGHEHLVSYALTPSNTLNSLLAGSEDICNAHKTGKPFPYQVSMSVEAKQFSEVLSLAADATDQGLKLTPSMCRCVVLAHICSGSMQQARQLLDGNAERMQNSNINVNVEDWLMALDLALQLPDRAIYWEQLRTLLRLHGKVSLSEFR